MAKRKRLRKAQKAGLLRNDGRTVQLFKEAKRYLVAGVNSPVRSFRYAGTLPLLIKRGQGAHVFDYDGNVYIDYVSGWGSLILGHAHPKVVSAVREAAGGGLSFGVTNNKEVELAQAISCAISMLKKIRFTNSGTEAVMSALRLARGYTNRPKVIKFSGFYHGCADSLLAKAGSGLATQGIPTSRGVPKEYLEHTLTVAYGDFTAVAKLFEKYGRQIAGVLVEPVGANCGVVAPDLSFLKYLRVLTSRYGALLIFDEVVTGFRLHYGSAAEIFGIEPDLITLGKIIGGGLPIGAFGGSGKIMNSLAPQGKVYQASTFSGNPVVMQAGSATLKVLSGLKEEYARLDSQAARLAFALKSAAIERGVSLEISQFAGLFSFKFRKKQHFKTFYRRLLEEGIFFAPSEFEANFLSFAHSEKDIQETVSKIKDAMRAI